ncbi:hypothetical protein VUR80DRAFT_2202 [Thermomyces stellatus]
MPMPELILPMRPSAPPIVDDDAGSMSFAFPVFGPPVSRDSSDDRHEWKESAEGVPFVSLRALLPPGTKVVGQHARRPRFSLAERTMCGDDEGLLPSWLGNRRKAFSGSGDIGASVRQSLCRGADSVSSRSHLHSGGFSHEPPGMTSRIMLGLARPGKPEQASPAWKRTDAHSSHWNGSVSSTAPHDLQSLCTKQQVEKHGAFLRLSQPAPES